MAYSISGTAATAVWQSFLISNGTTTATEVMQQPVQMQVQVFGQVVVPIIYCVIAFLGIFGNGLVLIVLWRLFKKRTATDIYITNLAIADLLLLCILPFWAADLILQEWVFGKAMCKVVSGLTYLCMNASIFFVTAMGLDRWLAVVKAIKCRSVRTEKNAWKFSIIPWCLGLLFMLLPLLFRSTKEQRGRVKCTWDFPGNYDRTLNILYNVMRTGIGFILPLVIILVCYLDLIRFMHKRSRASGRRSTQKGQTKVTKLVLAVITGFIFTWLPNQVTNLVNLLQFVGLVKYGCGRPYMTKSQNQFVESLNLTTTTSPGFFDQSSFTTITSEEQTTIAMAVSQPKDLPCVNLRLLMYAHYITTCLAFANSMINPIIYSLMRDKFKEKARQLLVCSTREETSGRRSGSRNSSRFTATTIFRTLTASRRGKKKNNTAKTTGNAEAGLAAPVADISAWTPNQERRTLFSVSTVTERFLLTPNSGCDSPITKRQEYQVRRNDEAKSNALNAEEEECLLTKVSTNIAQTSFMPSKRASRLDDSPQQQVSEEEKESDLLAVGNSNCH